MKSRFREIRAGKLTYVILSDAIITPNDSPKARAAKQKLSKSARELLNDRSSRMKLELMLAANFTQEDFFATFTFSDECLPQSLKEARARMKQFHRNMRTSRGKKGEEYSYIYCVEDGRRTGRFHVHAFINRGTGGREEIESLWPWGEILKVAEVKIEENDWCRDAARYMTKEMGALPLGTKAWVPSQGLKKPEVRTGFLADGETIEPPSSAYILERETVVNQYGSYTYLRYVNQEVTGFKRNQPRKSSTLKSSGARGRRTVSPEAHQRR